MDFVGPFPDAKGFNYMLVVICRLTSMVHLIPCRVTDSATMVAEYYIEAKVDDVKCVHSSNTCSSSRHPRQHVRLDYWTNQARTR